MKKILALVLSLVMIFSLATVTFAHEEVDPDDQSKWTTTGTETAGFTLQKLYTIVGEKSSTGAAVTENTIYPNEILNFTVSPATTNPDYNAQNISAMKNLTVGSVSSYTWDATTKAMKGTMTVTLPKYTQVGIYNYTITENIPVDMPAAGTPTNSEKAQGAFYNTNNAAIHIQVLVEYDFTNKCLKPTITLTNAVSNPGNSADRDHANVGSQEKPLWKLDTVENQYKLGELDVTKKVSGNLSDKNVQFQMAVKFTSANPVKSEITIYDTNNPTESGSTTVSDSKIAISGWTWDTATKKYTATATIYVKDGETVKFLNVPAGVQYEVTEDAKHGLGQDGFDPNSAKDTDYTITYGETRQGSDGIVNGKTGTITADTVSKTVVNNKKETNVDTGVVLDSAPYILMLVAAVMGSACLLTKKRYQV